MLLVAHDVNPLLPYLDRMIYLAGARALEGPLEQRHHRAETLSALYGAPIEVLRTARWTAGGGRTARGARTSRPPATRTIRALPCCLRRLDPIEPALRPPKQLLSYPFMVNALQAGTIVAVMAAVVGLAHGAAPPELRRAHDRR